MANKSINARINELFRTCRWDDARRLLEIERDKDPSNHWVVTQLGVTYYEQKCYKEAYRLFRASYDILDTCPLTLWNLAGALDALGKYDVAIRFYTWLLQSDKTPKDDPCWESALWTASLKADCLYRLGVCYQHLGRNDPAECCFREYLNLMARGIDGMYPADDVMKRLRSLQGLRGHRATGSKARGMVETALQTLGVKRGKGAQNSPPKLNDQELLVGRRVAHKKRD
jgi:hypothetical protein